jgi:hypothetical protein
VSVTVARTGVPSCRNMVYLVASESITPMNGGKFLPQMNRHMGGRFRSLTICMYDSSLATYSSCTL